jgi:hypothetical protein
MRIVRSSLARRVVAFVAAAAIVHIAFYAGPMWWYSRPRVYPEAYEKAVGILKEEFGEKAVEKGLIAIPRQAISLPYEGQAYVSGGGQRLVIDLRPGRDSCVFGVSAESTAPVARVSFERARDLWAIAFYLRWSHAALRQNVSLEFGRPGYDMGKGMFVERTWLSRRVSTTELPQEQMINGQLCTYFGNLLPSTPDNGIHEAAWARLIETLRARGELSRPCAADESQDAMKQTIEACFPCADKWDVEIANSLLRTYAENARKADLRLLKRIEAGSKPSPEWLTRVPVIGQRIADWDERRREYQVLRGPSPPVWGATHLAGKSREEHFRILVAAALQKRGATYDDFSHYAAHKILSDTREREWQEYLADHYESVSAEDFMAVCLGDNRLTRIIAEDNQSKRQALAWGALYGSTGDRRYADRLEKAAFGAASPEKDKVDAALWLLPSLCKSDSNYDFAKLMRDMLARMTAAYEGMGSSIAYALESAGTPACDALLVEIVARPDGVLPNDFAASGEGQDLRWQAGNALARRATADIARALVPYVARGCREGEARIWGSAVGAIGKAGDDAAIQMLEAMAASGAYGAASPNEPQPVYAIRHALALRRVMTVPQPVPAYLALDGDARWSLSARDLAQLTTEQLKELLATDAAAEQRVRILSALLWKRTPEEL